MFFVNENHNSKVWYLNKIEDNFITALAAQIAQTLKLMVSNRKIVAYRPTVFKTGLLSS